MTAARASRARMWRWPVGIGVVTGVGLVSALVADGPWDAVSWCALGLPVVVSAWYAWRPQRTG